MDKQNTAITNKIKLRMPLSSIINCNCVKHSSTTFCYALFTIIALLSLIFALSPIRGMFDSKYNVYYATKYSKTLERPPYVAYGDLTIRPDTTPTVCKMTLNPIAATCKPTEYFALSLEVRERMLEPENIAFIFVPGHMATGKQSLNIFGEIVRSLRKYGHRANNFYMLNFDEQPTAFSKGMIYSQADFLISLIEKIIAKQGNVNTTFVIFGSSLGGTVTTLAATKRPDIFSKAQAIITLSSPLNSHPLLTSVSISNIHKEIHEKSDVFPPLIQVYAGTNDFLVDVYNSKIDRYKVAGKYYQYVPAMKNVFFDLLHDELPLSPVIGPQVGGILGEYFVKPKSERSNIVEFWKSKGKLKVFDIDNDIPSVSIPGVKTDFSTQNTIELTEGATLINESTIKKKKAVTFRINPATTFASKDIPYVFVTTLSAASATVYYETATGEFLEQSNYDFSFKFPFNYHAIPLPASHVRNATTIYIHLTGLRLTNPYLKLKNYAVYNSTDYYVGLKEYKKCSFTITYNDLLFGHKFDFSDPNCFHYVFKISSDVPTHLISFVVEAAASQKVLRHIKYSTLILLRQGDDYTGVDFYMHNPAGSTQSIIEFPYPDKNEATLEFFGVDGATFDYSIEAYVYLIYPLQTLFRLHKFHIVNLSYALFIVLLIFQITLYSKSVSGEQPQSASPCLFFPILHMLFTKILYLFLLALGVTTVQYFTETWLRPYGLFGLDYTENGNRMHAISILYISTGGLVIVLLLCFLMAGVCLLLTFYANMFGNCFDLFKVLAIRRRENEIAFPEPNRPAVRPKWARFFARRPVRIIAWIITIFLFAFIGLFFSYTLCLLLLLFRLFIGRFTVLKAVVKNRRLRRAGKVTAEQENVIISDYSFAHFIFVLIVYGTLITAHKILAELIIGITFLGKYDRELWIYLPYYLVVLIVLFAKNRPCIQVLLWLRPLLWALAGYIALFGYDYMYRAGLATVIFMYCFIVTSGIDYIREWRKGGRRTNSKHKI